MCEIRGKINREIEVSNTWREQETFTLVKSKLLGVVYSS